MKSPRTTPSTNRFAPRLSGLTLACMLCFCGVPLSGRAQSPPPDSQKSAPTNSLNAASLTTQAAVSTNDTVRATLAEPTPPPTSDKAGASTNQDAQAKSAPPKPPATDEITVSFQGAPIDMVVQWLAQTTGKSVVKHPQVQCQLTIVSSKKAKPREAISLVYRALSLEGFTAIESSDSIFIVPEGKEPKMNVELVDASRKDIPEGRQRLVKMFALDHAQAADLREKVRPLLSEKGSIDSDERANRLVVTDFNENLRSAAELIKVLDVSSDADSSVEIYSLKNADAEELGPLLSLILNAQPPAPGPSGSSGRSSGPSGGPRSSGGGPVIIGGPSMEMASPPSPPASAPGGGAAGTSAPQIRIWPDKTANRIIVFAPKSKRPELERLLKVLDVDRPADVSVRVLPLKHVNAVDLVKEISPLYQRMSGRGLKDTIEVAASDRSNSLIVLSSEVNFHAIEKLIATLDTEEAQDKVMKTFPLKNADAEDVARQLQEVNRDQDSSSRYPYYFYSSSQAKPSRKASVVADRRRNSLIVQAPPAQMEGIERMIKQLDEPVTDDSLAPKIYPLKFVSAVDIEAVLNELFLKKTQQRSYYDYIFNDYGSEPTADRDVGRLYGKVRITSEPYANAIIVTSNSKESLAVLEDVLRQLDQPSEAGENTLHVELKFAKASTVANSINILFAKNGSPPLRPAAQPGQPGVQGPQQQQPMQNTASQSRYSLDQEVREEGYYPWLGGQPDNPRSSDGRTAARPASDLVGRVRAVADERSNGLLVSANVHYFPHVMKLIDKLDAPTDQVLIEARLVEVASDYLDKLGVRWSPDGSQVFTAEDYDNSLLGRANAQHQKGFGGQSTVNTPAAGANVAQTLTSLRTGVLDSTISMDFLVQFLRKTTAAKILAAPQINIRDNETGRLFVGQKVPTLTQSQNSGSIGLSQNFIYMDVGVILEVTPHINNKGDVELGIHAESSTVVPGQTVLGGVVIDSRAFKTHLTAHNGQTLVLGGIIQKQLSDTLRKTPILGSIPGLGWAFKKKDKTTREVELMVFLRPRITHTPEESGTLLDDIHRQAPNVKDWADDPHPESPPKGTKKNSDK